MPDEGHVLLRPRVVFAVLAVLVILSILFTPQPEEGAGATELSSYSAKPLGAKGFFEVAGRLGWRAERTVTPFRATLDSAAVYTVLAPPLPLTSSEAGVLLDAVRRGAGLIVVPAAGTPLSDSLHVRQSRHEFMPLGLADDPNQSDEYAEYREPFDSALHHTLQPTAPLPADTVVFLSLLARHRPPDSDGKKTGKEDSWARRPAPAMLGIPLGRGRVVAIADEEMLYNKVLRDDGAAVLPIRALEWVSPAPDARFVFDEFHYGFGQHPDLRRAIGKALFTNPAGRALAQILVAALLLLVATAGRPIAPAARERIERRSPLEHVGALARAYEQISATRLAARQLVRGLRRRQPRGAQRGLSDEQYLETLRIRYPALTGKLETVSEAIREPASPAMLLEVGRALGQIEHTLSPR